MAGRKKDLVWLKFDEVRGGSSLRAKCKDCGKEIRGLVARMKKHLENCNIDASDSGNEVSQVTPNTTGSNNTASASSSTSSCPDAPPTKKNKPLQTSRSSNMGNFVVRTSKPQKEELDQMIAEFIYATNSSFRTVGHPKFLKMIYALRPGYTPPSRSDVAGKLLDKCYEEERDKCAKILEGQIVCMDLDGWSNVNSDPVICASITTADTSTPFLVDSIDTTGHRHTSNYLVEVASALIKKCENEFGCKVKSFVTDNAANVASMRKELEKDSDIIMYGCSAHLLNLLAHDLEISGVKSQVVEVVKYFRNNHFASAKFSEVGLNKLVLPQDVRWNTMCQCLETYLNSWPSLVSICEDNRDNIKKDISTKVLNIGLKRNAEDLLERLKPIAIALQKIQKHDCTIANALEIWLELKTQINNLAPPQEVKTALRTRFEQAITPAHYAAYMLHPKYFDKFESDLSLEEQQTAMEMLTRKHPDLTGLLINFRARASPFPKYMFSEEATSVPSVSWWKSQSSTIGAPMLNVAIQLLTAVPSSAGVERIFSSFGLVQSKLRNQLGIEKAGKLVFLYRMLNTKWGEENKEGEGGD